MYKQLHIARDSLLNNKYIIVELSYNFLLKPLKFKFCSLLQMPSFKK